MKELRKVQADWVNEEYRGEYVGGEKIDRRTDVRVKLTGGL